MPRLPRRRDRPIMGGLGSGRPPGSPSCGTPAGYRRHKYLGETACRACKDAYAEHYRKQRGRKLRPPKMQGTANSRHRKKQQAIVRQWKLDKGSCMDCGLTIDERTVICIDCDHRDPSQKSFTISYEIGRKSTEQIIEELAKCDAICRNCHALRTHDKGHHMTRRSTPIEEPRLFNV